MLLQDPPQLAAPQPAASSSTTQIPQFFPEEDCGVYSLHDGAGGVCFEVIDFRSGRLPDAPNRVFIPAKAAGVNLTAQEAWKLHCGEEVSRLISTRSSPVTNVILFAEPATTPEGLARVEDVRCHYTFCYDGSPHTSSYLVRHPVHGRAGSDDDNRVMIPQAPGGRGSSKLTARQAHQLVHGTPVEILDGRGQKTVLQPAQIESRRASDGIAPSRAVVPTLARPRRGLRL